MHRIEVFLLNQFHSESQFKRFPFLYFIENDFCFASVRFLFYVTDLSTKWDNNSNYSKKVSFYSTKQRKKTTTTTIFNKAKVLDVVFEPFVNKIESIQWTLIKLMVVVVVLIENLIEINGQIESVAQCIPRIQYIHLYSFDAADNRAYWCSFDALHVFCAVFNW